MTFPAKHLALLVPLLLTGCIFHKNQSRSVQAFAPPVSKVPKPEPTHPDLPESATTIPTEPIESADDDDLPVRPVYHHRYSARPPQQTTNLPPATPASDPPAVSAIGELSTGEPSSLRHSVEESIASTDRGLNNIGRSLNFQEQKTAAQIHGFLRQAREALNAGDVDGAKTLASKAKVLLSELNQ
jgi:hypothetical protein